MDPGFDGCKVCINGFLLNIPFSIYEINKETQFITNSSSKNFIRSEVDGKMYLLGEEAKISLLEKKQRETAGQMDTFYTMGRFASTEFKVALKSFLGYALYEYEQYCATKNEKNPFTIKALNTGKVELNVGIALPHSQKDEIWENNVKAILLEPMDFTIRVGASEPVDFHIKLSEENIGMNSQVLSAMYCAILDEKGKVKEGSLSRTALPMLVIDAGYLTVGIFLLSRTGQVVFAKSNQEFAMHNVNERTANIIKQHISNVTSYNIETLAKDNEELYYKKDNGEYDYYNVAELRKAEIERAATNLTSYLVKEFDDLLDIKSIIMAGGTGEKYFEHMKPAFDLRKRTSLLVEPELDGETYDSVYAVVVGLYRTMLTSF